MLKKVFYILLLSLIPFLAFPIHGDKNKSVAKVVTGKVTDAFGEVLPGTKIKIKETGETFFADFDGQFKFTLQGDKTFSLVFETLGFEAVEFKSTELQPFSELTLKPL